MLVSHDRHLVAVTCDELWLINSGKAERFDGDLDDYAQWLRTWRSKQTNGAPISVVAGADLEKAAKPVAAPAAIEPSASKKPVRSADLRAAQKAVERSEQTMLDAQANVESIAERLGDSALYEPAASDELAAMLQQQKQAQKTMEQAESAWLAATEALEVLTT